MSDIVSRKHLLRELSKAFPSILTDDVNRVLLGDPMWYHLTDWNGKFDLPLLLEEGLIEFHPTAKYKPTGSWQDKFPPTAYRLTLKAKAIFFYTNRWVFDGYIDTERAQQELGKLELDLLHKTLDAKFKGGIK